MPRYFFHLHECKQGVMLDQEGQDAGDIDAARAIAVDMARATMASEVAQGNLCLSCWIVIADADGHNLTTLQFGDAITMVDERSHCSAFGADGSHTP